MQLISRQEFLEVFAGFKKAPPNLVEEILFSSTFNPFRKDAFLYREGDRCGGIGLFLSGEVRVYKIGGGGREVTLYEIYPGDTCILNASSILANKAYPGNACCLTDGSMLFLPQADFRRLLSGYEEMRRFIFSYFSERLTAMIEMIEDVTFGRLDFRLLDYLIEKADNQVLVTTHQQIANDLGTSREVVSRLLKNFEHQEKLTLARNKIMLKTI